MLVYRENAKGNEHTESVYLI